MRALPSGCALHTTPFPFECVPTRIVPTLVTPLVPSVPLAPLPRGGLSYVPSVHEKPPAAAQRKVHVQRRTIGTAPILSTARGITLLGAVVNVALSLLKVIAGMLGNSPALVADAAHSCGDLLSDAFCLIGASTSSLERLSTCAIGMMLLSTGCGLVAYGFSSLRFTLTTAPLATSVMMEAPALLVALVSIASKEYMYRLTHMVGLRSGSTPLIANAHHHRSDAMSSVAAAVGICGSMLGVPWLEPVAVLAVSFAVLRMGVETLASAIHDRRQLEHAHIH